MYQCTKCGKSDSQKPQCQCNAPITAQMTAKAKGCSKVNGNK